MAHTFSFTTYNKLGLNPKGRPFVFIATHMQLYLFKSIIMIVFVFYINYNGICVMGNLFWLPLV